MREKLDGTPVGQNLHFGLVNYPRSDGPIQEYLISKAPKSWFDEVKDFNNQHIDPFK